MSLALPNLSPPRITVPEKPPSAGSVARLDALCVILSTEKPRFRDLPDGPALGREASRRESVRHGGVFSGCMPSARGRPLFVGFLKPGAAPHDALSLARKLLAAAKPVRARRIGLHAAGPDAAHHREALLAGALAASIPMPDLRQKPAADSPLAEIRLFAAGGTDPVAAAAEAEGNGLARWLTALPPNVLGPRAYRVLLETLANREGWTAEFLGTAELEKAGAGAFRAVAQGSGDDGAGILRLKYRPGKGRRPQLALVGKGIVFDTGGTNLKPFRGMLDMHGDMQGSAVAVGTLLALTRLEWPEPVDCWLAITANRTGPRAYTSRDVVVAANGQSIEVIHTDAEGRMALADTLVLAGRESPKLIIDYATLTGASVAALTSRYSAVFSNRDDWLPALTDAGRRSGERVWPFPMDPDFDEELKSDLADVLQCSVDNDGDHILAARFLQRFVPATSDWIHLDLGAGHRKGGLGHVPTAFTGFGVRYTLALLRSTELPERPE
jgi:leucyl aminopeptidase